MSARATAPRRLRLLLTGLAGLGVAFLALGLFSQTVYNRAHNEQMYVAAGYLLAKGERLYTDFAFVQMPYSALTYAAVYSVTGAGSYLLKAKLVNFVWLALAGVLLYARARRLGLERLAALLLLVVFLADYYVLRATIEASNYTLPLALGLLAYGWLLRGVEGRSRVALACFGAGVALGAATGAKLYYAALAAPFALVALLYPRQIMWRRRLLHQLLPLAAGGLLGLAPALRYALAGPDRFYFNNVRYHLLNALWREQNGFTDMGGRAKLETARELVTNPNYLILLLWLALALLLWWSRRETPPGAPSPGVLLAGLAAGASLLAAFAPRPLFPQYFVMPVPFLLLWVAEIAAGLPRSERRLLEGFGMVVVVVGVLAVLPRHSTSLQRFFAADEPWSGVAVVRDGQELAGHLAARSYLDPEHPPMVATLAPVLALEAGLPFYPELATGSFVYRIGDLLTAQERARYVATSPSTLAAFLDAQPPAAIYVGEEEELEAPLRDYAESRGYTLVDEELAGGQLYVR